MNHCKDKVTDSQDELEEGGVIFGKGLGVFRSYYRHAKLNHRMDISILSYDGTIYKYILQLIEDKECFIQRRVSGDSKVSLYGGE